MNKTQSNKHNNTIMNSFIIGIFSSIIASIIIFASSRLLVLIPWFANVKISNTLLEITILLSISINIFLIIILLHRYKIKNINLDKKIDDILETNKFLLKEKSNDKDLVQQCSNHLKSFTNMLEAFKKLDRSVNRCGTINEELLITKDKIREFINYTDFLNEGILEIKTRTKYDNEFWKSFVLDAKEELFLSGHSLNTWLINKDLKDTLKNTIQKVVNSGGEVKILTQTLSGVKNINIKRKNLVNLLRQIKVNGTGNLTFKEINYLPYIISHVDNRTMIAHYKKNGNEEIYMMNVKHGSRYANMYLTDFNEIFENLADKVNL